MRKHGLNPNLMLWNQIPFKFNSAGLVPQLWTAYSETLLCKRIPNLFTYNVLIHAFCKMGRLEMGLDLLRTSEIDTISYNTLIWGSCNEGMVELAVGFLSKMVKKGISIDSIIWNTLIHGFFQKGLLENA